MLLSVKESGQGLLEVVIIIALLVLVAIFLLKVLKSGFDMGDAQSCGAFEFAQPDCK